MAEILVNLVLGRLCDTALQEIFFLCGVKEKVKHVRRELERIQCFLRDADRKSVGDERVKNWVNELRGVSHWIEDTVDLFVMKLDKGSAKDPRIQKPNLKQKLKNMFKKPEKLIITHKFGKEIDKILARIVEISKSRETYGIKNLDESSEVEDLVPFKRPIFPELDDTELIGVVDEKEKIVAQLLDEKCLRRSVVSIVGPGGLGKTTVAEKAYSSNAVKRHFDVRIWLSISQNFTLTDLSKKILEGIRRLDDEEKKQDKEYFIREVNKLLRERRYLVVLDDVWSDDLWPQIASALPNVKNGSRILMTSRFYNIPKVIDPTSEPHKLRLLNEEESIHLLLKTALPNRNDDKDGHTNLSEIAKQLAMKCDGLPLALVVLGSRLSLKLPMHHVWEKVLNTMVWTVDGKNCMDILATSYDDLPINLKSCFMYLACIPEDYKIDAQDLIQLWIAEGFVQISGNKTMEDVAEDYLEELAQRSMIQVTERSFQDNSIVKCRIHDLLRDVAIEKAKENNFLMVHANGDEEQDFGEVRRLAVHNFDSTEWMKHVSPNLRTLFCFNSKLPDCSGHKLLKILYVDEKKGFRFDNQEEYDLRNIEGLSQLRYLNIQHTSVASNEAVLDKLICSMKYLQKWDVTLESPEQIPDCLWHIKSLRHVYIPWFVSSTLLGNPQSIVLQDLQTLSYGNNVQLQSANLPMFPHLRKLYIKESDNITWSAIVAFLHTLKELVDLDISGYNIPIEVLDMKDYPFYEHLTSLSYNEQDDDLEDLTDEELFSGLGSEIFYRTTIFPIHLTKLNLLIPYLSQYHISILEKLPELKVFELYGGYREKKMRCSRGGFPNLEYFWLFGVRLLEVWEIEMEAMQMLKKLTIRECPRIQVPHGLRNVTTLRDLTWEKSGGIHDRTFIAYVCRHVPFITFYPSNF